MKSYSKSSICELLNSQGSEIPKFVQTSPDTAWFAFGWGIKIERDRVTSHGFVPLHRVDDDSESPKPIPGLLSINPQGASDA